MMKRLAGIAAVLLASTGGAWAAECAGLQPVVDNATSFTGPILSANAGGGPSTCTTTAVPLVVPNGMYGVYEVTSRGGYTQNSAGDNSTYSVTAFGQTHTVQQAGMSSDDFALRHKFATGQVGADTNFDGTFSLDVTGDPSSLATIDSLDMLVGYTSLASQQQSLDEIGLEQLAIGTHLDATAGLLTGANQPLEGDDEFGLIGGVGSFTLGATGRYNLADGFSVLGGVSVIDLGVPGASATGVLAAGALRFVEPGAGELRYVGEAGAQVAALGLGFSRHYDNGTSSHYEATGSGNGFLGSVYVRGGALWAPDPSNDVLFSATLKQGALGIGSLVENDPDSAANLFSADLSGSSTSFTTIKAGIDWTNRPMQDVDLTASVALGSSFANGGASADVFGVGTVTGSAQSTLFAEYGLRLGWDLSPVSRVDGFVEGSTGTGIGTHTQIGAAYHQKF